MAGSRHGARPSASDHLALVSETPEPLTKAKAHTHEHTSDRMFVADKPMKQLARRANTAYEKVLDKIYRELLRYIAKNIVRGAKLPKLRKAEGDDTAVRSQLLLLTPMQLADLEQIVRDYHQAFALGMFGPDVLPPEERERLVRMGIVPEDLSTLFVPSPGETAPTPLRVTDLAYQYGVLRGDPEQREAVRDMSADQFLEHLRSTRDELNPVERQAMAFARYNAGQHVTGMGDRVSFEMGTRIRNADAEQRRRYMGVIRRELEDNIDRRQSWRKLASEIGHATKDWSRDMQRVAATEKQNAMQEGQARQIVGERDPKDVRVFKRVAPDGCKECVRLFLTAGRGSPPKVFTMKELIDNGTNVGLKRADWKPVVGSVHPWCGCELGELPEGWGFDEEGVMLPESMIEKGDRLDHALTLLKSEDHDQETEQRPHMTHRDAVPTDTVVVRIGDPHIRQVVEAVIAEAPPEIFHRDVGVTLITTDTPRVQNPLEDHDFGYWTANEIRLHQTLPIERIPRVLRHELGHSLNVYLLKTLGSTAAVRAWHAKLWALSQAEGFVSAYAAKMPIENAAEVTRFYLFEKPRLMLHFPRQFAYAHRHYRKIFE